MVYVPTIDEPIHVQPLFVVAKLVHRLLCRSFPVYHTVWHAPWDFTDSHFNCHGISPSTFSIPRATDSVIMVMGGWVSAVYLPYVPTTVIDFPAQGECFQTGRVLRRHRRSIIGASSRLRLGNTRKKCKGLFKSISFLHHNLLLKFC